MEIFPGNFCYPLNENYLSVKEKNFFFRYYGEDKLEEVAKKQLSFYQEAFPNLPDDLLSNAFILLFCKSTKTIRELRNELKIFFALKTLDIRTINKRIKILYDRYHSLILNESKCFYHMSCGISEEKNFETMIGTNKQLFCGICWKYDCSLHQQAESLFDNPTCYNIKEYIKSYKEMIELAHGAFKDKEHSLAKVIRANCEKYNAVINENKLRHLSDCLNVFDEKNSDSSYCKIGKLDHCGGLCFKNFISLDQTAMMQIYNQIKTLPNIFELYLSKLVRILKYNPCAIAKCLKLVCVDKKTKQNQKHQSIIECYLIFIRLISNDFAIDKPLSPELIELLFHERNNDKKKIFDTQRLKQIKENAKHNRIIPYHPCYHLGNEPCNINCPCSKRGFCEKYCACNKLLCKLNWNGCRCRGPCISSSCACYVNSRECDIDLCQNCRNEKTSCKNLKLKQMKYKLLGVAISKIVGWGLFAREEIGKDELIGEYIGEIVDMDDMNERSEFIDLEKSTYMFTLNDDYTVDSRTMGNVVRFSNHSKAQANAYTKIVFANGNHRICLFAKENIKKDEEILFDYDGQNILCNKYDWINDLEMEKREIGIKNEKRVMIKRKRQRRKGSKKGKWIKEEEESDSGNKDIENNIKGIVRECDIQRSVKNEIARIKERYVNTFKGENDREIIAKEKSEFSNELKSLKVIKDYIK